MPTIDPIPHALVAADSAAADALGAPNYDEFQSDLEVWQLLQQRPDSVLRVSMPHCDVAGADEIGEDGSEAALARAAATMGRLTLDERVRHLTSILWIYEITRPERPDRPQIGLGGMARTDEIRTPENPTGTIIRNEGIREGKARGRSRLTQATGADLGVVNLAVDDDTGAFEETLESHTLRHAPSFETTDEAGNRHRVWLIEESAAVETWRSLLAREPHAYVADGNHRSAAAAMLGYEHFMTVFFPARTMTIAPYNRLLEGIPVPVVLPEAVRRFFDINEYDGGGAYQPLATHEIGIYDGDLWWRLTPRHGTFDPNDAAQDIDADIVQRNLFADVFGITDARDDRITYVGANRGAEWLQSEVDNGRFTCGVTLPPVTMEQFIKVCRQNRLMPPKSTWFVPKVRTGLVTALLR
jgi:uncharacterized protein (DUF1015 family)